MAKMFPEVAAEDLEHSSEAPVYEALRDGLPDDFIVLHSYPWLRPWRAKGALREGEADFVVLHPELGLLVLEVKGGENIRHDGRRWFRDNANGPKEFQDPLNQAQRNMHALVSIVEERSGGRLRGSDFVHGYGVVFPHLDYDGNLPSNADPAIVINRKDLPFIKGAIEFSYRKWTSQPRPIPRDRFLMLAYDCLMPRFRLFRPISADIGGIRDKLLELTEVQAQVFEGLYEHSRVLVKGVAGSGKTFLALHRAKSFAMAGQRTLFVCYNKALANWIRGQIMVDPATEPYRENLVVRHFHGLAAELAKEADLAFKPEHGGGLTPEFWENEVPELMEQAAFVLTAQGAETLFDAIVVDEAQDFTLGWWVVLTQALMEDPSGPLYAFMDPNQSLRGDPEILTQEFQTTFNLQMNCRNTRRIAAASASLLELESSTFDRAPRGIVPRIVRAPSSGSVKGLVLGELRRLLTREDVAPGEIAVIGPAAKRKGSLAGETSVDGVPLVTDAERWRSGDGVLVTTARSFKGLESDVVVLYDVSDFGSLFTREDLYVACTRPRALLIAVAEEGACRVALEDAAKASELE
jgi:hypothetical protein